MSTTTHQSAEHRQCDRDSCSETYYSEALSGHAGFCSRVCWAQATAHRLLSGVCNDHKYCANCFRRIKLVVPPGRSPSSKDKLKDVPECAIGWAYYEGHTIRADGEAIRPRDEAGAWVFAPTGDIQRRQTCSCPVTHHKTVDTRTLSKSECVDHVRRLTTVLDERRADGHHNYALDTDAMVHIARSMKSDRDLSGDDRHIFRRSLAVGLAMADKP